MIETKKEKSKTKKHNYNKYHYENFDIFEYDVPKERLQPLVKKESERD